MPVKEDLFQIVRALPARREIQRPDSDPTLLELNDFAVLMEGLYRQRKILGHYLSTFNMWVQDQKNYRSGKLDKKEFDSRKNYTLQLLRDNFANDFLFGAIYESGTSVERILFAKEIGLLKETYISWEELCKTNPEPYTLQTTRLARERLSRFNLKLPLLSQESLPEDYRNFFSWMIALDLEIHSKKLPSNRSRKSTLKDLSSEIEKVTGYIFKVWLEKNVSLPPFYQSILIESKMERDRNRVSQKIHEIQPQWYSTWEKAEKDGYHYDGIFDRFSSKA